MRRLCFSLDLLRSKISDQGPKRKTAGKKLLLFLMTNKKSSICQNLWKIKSNICICTFKNCIIYSYWKQTLTRPFVTKEKHSSQQRSSVVFPSRPSSKSAILPLNHLSLFSLIASPSLCHMAVFFFQTRAHTRTYLSPGRRLCRYLGVFHVSCL